MSRSATLVPEQETPLPIRLKRRSNKLKPKAHKYSRLLHAYLSAFAFLILMFFAASGLLLNHPEWLAGSDVDDDQTKEIFLTGEGLVAAAEANDEGANLARFVQDRLELVGAFQSAEVFPGEEAFLRFSGVKGRSDVTIDLVTGAVEYEVVKAGLVQIIHGLHRGKDSGAAWKSLIDVSAVLILFLSLFGFLLMFFIKFRLANSVLLLGGSSLAIGVIYVIFVP
ncbi:MAG: PepSY-associated TM helix domain-containing protein [Opitutaceae bacterium]|nr:PepSY-associated TM helix domain-containing protein [Opitutaceae bacterium]